MRSAVKGITGSACPTYGPEGQYSTEVQQRPPCLTRSASSRCVRASVNKTKNRLLRGVRDEEVEVQILSPRPLFSLIYKGIMKDDWSACTVHSAMCDNGRAPVFKCGNGCRR
jgi:hypothetical protein